MTTSKKCSRCQVIKENDQFNKNKQSEDGLQRYCKECRRAKHIENKEHNCKHVKANYYKNHENNKAKNKERSKTISGRFSCLKNGAKKRNIKVALTLLEYSKVVASKKCHYCNKSLPEFGCGVDRIDSTEAYTVVNSVACCGQCNTIKSDILSYTEMLEVAKLLKRLRNE